jgi:hypothetical protein
MRSLLFLFNALALPGISSKSLKFKIAQLRGPSCTDMTVYKAVPRPNQSPAKEQITGRTSDLSLFGCHVNTLKHLAPGTKVRLRIVHRGWSMPDWMRDGNRLHRHSVSRTTCR